MVYDDVKISLSSKNIKMSAENVRTINGKDGQDGKSAYEIAVDSGYVGTQEEWLESLKGKDGEQGPQGEQGIQGETGATGATGKDGKDGATGANGQDGVNGKSAYDLAVDSGYSGTQEEWLASLKGEKGDTGATGAKGDKGDTGSIEGLPEGFGEDRELSLKMNSNCSARGYGSVAMGASTTSGSYSVAEGYSTASGQCSHAEGSETVALNFQSHAEGSGTIAASQNQHVQGRYNIEDADEKYADIIGCGSGEGDRKNAYTLDWSGNAWFSGTIKIGGRDYNNSSKEVAVKSDIPNLSNYALKTDLSNYALKTDLSNYRTATQIQTMIDNKFNSIVNGNEVSY